MVYSLIIGGTSGTGTGKSSICKQLLDEIKENVIIICHDMYYKDFPYLPVAERGLQNFDNPDALDNELFVSHFVALKKEIL
jgi:uridine kinase